jgi:hypothetical protein
MSSGKSGIATLLGLRGDKPKVPDFDPIDPSDEQRQTIAGNLANLPGAANLARQSNDASAANYLAFMEKVMPGFGQNNSKIMENIRAMLSGQLPSDVENYIGRKAAEKGIVRGTGGSQFDQYGALRDLGLTSLEVTDRGLDAATRWLSASRAPMMDHTAMFISPMQRINVTQWNKTMQWQRDWLNNQIKALPSNEEMAYAQMLDYVADFATMAAGVGVGSIGGGGGGQQSQQQPFNAAEMSQVYNSYGPGY